MTNNLTWEHHPNGAKCQGLVVRKRVMLTKFCDFVETALRVAGWVELSSKRGWGRVARSLFRPF